MLGIDRACIKYTQAALENALLSFSLEPMRSDAL